MEGRLLQEFIENYRSNRDPTSRKGASEVPLLPTQRRQRDALRKPVKRSAIEIKNELASIKNILNDR